MSTVLDANTVRIQIDAIRRAHPEVFEDEDFAADVLEGETDLFGFMARLEEAVFEAEAMAQAITDRRRMLAERSARFTARADAIREMMAGLLDTAGLTKMPLPEATIALRQTPPKVVVIEEAEIPEAFWRVKREIDKAALSTALKSGTDIPGAMLTNGGRTLQIRRS